MHEQDPDRTETDLKREPNAHSNGRFDHKSIKRRQSPRIWPADSESGSKPVDHHSSTKKPDAAAGTATPGNLKGPQSVNQKPRPKLTSILQENRDATNLKDRFDSTPAAPAFSPLPRGDYVARVLSGELSSINPGREVYTITFEVIEGEYSRRRLWQNLWFTEAAIPRTKRELAKLGVTNSDQLHQPLPEGYICRVSVTVRVGNDGTERNSVARFEVLRTEKPTDEPFAPQDEPPPTPPKVRKRLLKRPRKEGGAS